jgi:hypothetical protein
MTLPSIFRTSRPSSFGKANRVALFHFELLAATAREDVEAGVLTRRVNAKRLRQPHYITED